MNDNFKVALGEMSESELMQLRGEIDEALAKQSAQKAIEVDGVATRLEKIGAYKGNAKLLADAAEQKRLDEARGLVRQIQALKPRIDELLAVGNACLESGIEINKYGNTPWGGREYDEYERGTFVTNSISHKVGFAKDWGRNSAGPHRFTMLGINAGGACGAYDFRTNGDIVCFSHESKQGNFKDASYDLGDLRGFLRDFDEFESAFYAYVDKMIEKQQKSVDALLADAQGRVTALVASGKSDVEKEME